MNSVLVVGAGPAGMQAAIDLADSGHKVLLVEKEEELGGNLRNLCEISPSNKRTIDVLSTYLGKIEKNKNISVMKKSEVQSFSGSFPTFQVTVKTPEGEQELTVNAVVVAIGFQPYNPSGLKSYGYGKFAGVVTALELERMLMKGYLLNPANKKEPKSVAFIQCVGSRDLNFNAYCSDFCCNNTVKLAKIIRRDHPGIAVSVFYMDMRTPYEGEMEFRSARRLGVNFLRGKPAKVREEDGAFVVRVEDTLENDLVFVQAELVVLSVGGVPNSAANVISQAMKINLTNSGFFAVDETTVGTNAKGIFVAGAASGPKDVAHSIVQGSCAAAKVNIVRAKET